MRALSDLMRGSSDGASSSMERPVRSRYSLEDGGLFHRQSAVGDRRARELPVFPDYRSLDSLSRRFAADGPREGSISLDLMMNRRASSMRPARIAAWPMIK